MDKSNDQLKSIKPDSRNYFPTEVALRGIERGLRDAADGKFATQAEVEAVFTKYRRR